MAASALTEKLTAAGALGRYGGAETVLRFSDSKTEFAALLSGAGVYDLSWRAKLAIRGRDRVRWFNGMVSNNVRDLASGRGVYSFVLNPQGRILGDFYAWNRGEEFLVDTDLAQLPNLLALWRKFIIMDKVELVEVAEQFAAIGVQGPNAAEVLRAAGIQVPELQPLQMRQNRGVAGSDTLLAKAIALNDRDASAHFELGTVLDRLQRFADAAREFKKATELDPADAAAHYRLSRDYERLGAP